MGICNTLFSWTWHKNCVCVPCTHQDRKNTRHRRHRNALGPYDLAHFQALFAWAKSSSTFHRAKSRHDIAHRLDRGPEPRLQQTLPCKKHSRPMPALGVENLQRWRDVSIACFLRFCVSRQVDNLFVAGLSQVCLKLFFGDLHRFTVYCTQPAAYLQQIPGSIRSRPHLSLG